MASTHGNGERNEDRYIGTITNIGNSQGLYIDQGKLDESGLNIGDQVIVEPTDDDDVRGLELVKLNDVLDY